MIQPNVGFAPDSDQTADIARGRLSANYGQMLLCGE